MSDPNIVSRFDEIYDSTNKAVLALITAKCGRTADINDIYQDAYMELYQILNKRGTGYVTNEKALMLKIAKRKIARHYSLIERMRIFVSLTSKNEYGEEVELSEFNADDFRQEDFADNYADLETTRLHILSKPEDVQKIFYLMYDVGLTIAETAQALLMSQSNVKNKLYRTLKELRELLK